MQTGVARGLLAAEGVVVFFLDTRILGTGEEVMTGFVRVRGGLPLRETSVEPESGNSGGARSGPRGVWREGAGMSTQTLGGTAEKRWVFSQRALSTAFLRVK